MIVLFVIRLLFAIVLGGHIYSNVRNKRSLIVIIYVVESYYVGFIIVKKFVMKARVDNVIINNTIHVNVGKRKYIQIHV